MLGNIWIAGSLACLVAALASAGEVSKEAMQKVFDEVKTPYKYGIVVRGNGGNAVDCPSVFSADGRWWMIYTEFDGSGYITRLATSEDLLAWKPLGVLLKRPEKGWDAQQSAGYVALQDPTWGGSCEMEQFDGKYWMTYIGGALKGYETDPLSIGVAFTTHPTQAAEWSRLDKPVLGPNDADARGFEQLTLYKSNVLHDKDKTLGHPFVMFYNAKKDSGYERIGMAVSDDMRRWTRYGKDPVVDNGSGISGDPQIVRMGDLWVMFYFGAFWQPKAFDTFACSTDLVHWTKWTGPHLVEPSEPWDREYAHKPWLVKHKDVVYHFYCAVGGEGRTIALATSRNLHTERQPDSK